ncbi:MAG: hypothetical protein ACI8W3_001187 [Myxococcota bacterium]
MNNKKMQKVSPQNFTRHDAHPFEPSDESSETCTFCGAPKARILHHPTRVRAAVAVRECANASQRKQAAGEN